MSRTRDFSKGHATTSGNIHIPIGGAVEQHLKYSGTSGVAVWSTIALGYIDGLQVALDAKIDDSQVLTNVPSGALFTDTVYSKPSAEPISYITNLQVALDAKTTPGYVDTKVADLIDSAPGTLDTLNELAAALGDDPNHVTTMTTLIGTKVDDSQVLTNVPSGALFTDTVYSKPSAEPISYITNLQVSLDGKEAADATILKDADIGVNVQAYDSTIVVDADIGTTVLAPDGDGSALTNLPASGGVITAIASGALPNGKPVILKSDGTVEVVSATTISESIPLSSATTYKTATTQYQAAVYAPLDSTKFIIGFSSSGCRLVVGSVSGSTITFSSETLVTSNSVNIVDVAFQPNSNKFVVMYQDDTGSKSGILKLYTLSGTSVTLNDTVTFDSNGNSGGITASFSEVNTSVMVLSYTPYAASSYGRVRTASISGTSLSLGTEVVYNSVYTVTPDAKFLSNSNTFVVAYRNNSNHTGEVRAGEVSGASITVGSATVYRSSNVTNVRIATNYGVSSSFALTWSDSSTGYTTVVAGTASGTGIDSIGSVVSVTNWAQNNSSGLTRQPESNKFLISIDGEYTGSFPQYGMYVYELTVTGVTITVGTQKTLISPVSSGYGFGRMSLNVNTNKQFIVSYRESSNSYGKAIVGQLLSVETNLAADNYIGISDDAYANAATATIQVVGATDDAQSGLTTGSKHYVQGDGTLSTTPDSPSVYAGKALSATKLLIKG